MKAGLHLKDASMSHTTPKIIRSAAKERSSAVFISKEYHAHVVSDLWMLDAKFTKKFMVDKYMLSL